MVHPAPGNYTGTLVNALLLSLRQPPVIGPGTGGSERERAGIVHRLDKDTSGVMVVARTEEALRPLSAQFKARIVQKKYLALVAGRDQEGFGHDRGRARQAREGAEEDQRAYAQSRARRSRCSRSRSGSGTRPLSRWRSRPAAPTRSGCTWPISAIRSWATGPTAAPRRRKSAAAGVARQMLHAESLSLLHPDTGHPMTFIAPPPADMAEILDLLQEKQMNEAIKS